MADLWIGLALGFGCCFVVICGVAIWEWWEIHR